MYEYLKTWLELKTDRRAVTALEYGLIAALIAAVLVTVLTNLGSQMNIKFNSIKTGVASN